MGNYSYETSYDYQCCPNCRHRSKGHEILRCVRCGKLYCLKCAPTIIDLGDRMKACPDCHETECATAGYVDNK